ncbi:MAG TPA: hypothetical protein VM054_01645 [bacterium]|nr:hypothetical protein [bacterium]
MCKKADDIVVYACDVGSTRGENFGWAKCENGEIKLGTNKIDELVNELSKSLYKKPVALGFECPCFLPIPGKSAQLSKGRVNEHDRSCFAPAGGYVATLGIHQMAFIFDNIKQNVLKVSVNYSEWDKEPKSLFIWEAFVSGAAHSDDNNHMQDAATAVDEFIKRYNNGSLGNSDVTIPVGSECISLAGLACRWSNLPYTNDVLREELMVIKPTEQYKNEIENS